MNTLNILIHQLEAMWKSAVQLLPSLVIAVVVLILTWLIAKFARRISDRLTTRTSMRPSLQALVETLIGIAIWIVGILTAATIVLPGLTPASLLAGLGIGTVAIGFAFQDIFENFLAGILILLRKKMRIGDMISCDGIEGRVEQIMLRETHVRKLSNELTVVPNSKLFKNPVEILTDNDQRRHEIVAGVSYDTDLEQARAVILKAVEEAEGVDTDQRIDVFAREFNSSSIDFTVRWWAGSKPIDMHRTRDSVIRNIKRALDEAGIEIPFPYVTNTFKEPLRIVGEDDQGTGESAGAGAGAA
ncbi:hypothetical protein GCM10023219_07020 [Stakelama sediminis]|uniref:Small-conductance mechanosensitive channel n=1 Tax=Stakelama sediminis TaxID=463200 RepID=A0A840YV09_9SPHN|nr:mechanosensitive ion channel [Stakelama sediminis]MBB5717422.1 small-conductance mechanosensitive channel [Stakelama sediminis]